MRRLRVIGLLALLAMAFGSVSADAYVYWADFNGKRIGRASNDGSVVEPAFIQLAAVPTDVEVNSTHIFWTDESGKAIGRANLDGTNIAPHFVSTGNQPNGVAVNGSHIYWSSGLGNAIGRAKLDGTGANPTLVSGISAGGVALDSGHVYWTNGSGNGRIGRSDLNGGLVNAEYVKFGGTPFLRGLDVNTSNIFWADWIGGGTNIGRVNVLNGLNPDPSFIGDAQGPCSVAVFGSQLYWSNTKTNTIGRANTDSSGVNQSFVTVGGANSICGIAVDALAPLPQPGNPGGSGGGGTTPPPSDVTPPQTRIAAGPGKRLDEGRASFLFSAGEAATFSCKLDARKAIFCGRQGAIVCMAISPQCLPHRSYSGLKPGRHTFKVWATDAAGNKDPTPAKRRFRVVG